MAGDGAVAILIIDEAGQVIAEGGSQHREPASHVVCGQTWREALSALVEPETLPGSLPQGNMDHDATAKDGRKALVLYVPWQHAGRRGMVIALETVGHPQDPRTQHLGALGMLAAGAAHEINNILMVMSGWLELAKTATDEESRVKAFENVTEAVERLSALPRNLLNFSRAENISQIPLDVNRLVTRIMEMVKYQLQIDNIIVVKGLFPQPLVVGGMEGELQQTLVNLVMNARQAMPKGGTLRITTRRENGCAFVEVADSGCGIAPEVQDRIFEPFFTTRRDSGGTGLGLPFCREVVRRHAGEISVASKPGVGTTITLRFPLYEEPIGN
jgi:signal transduction histidine kinase